MGSAEARDIAESCGYRNPAGLEGKYFYPTELDLDAIEARASAATGVRWETGRDPDGAAVIHVDLGNGRDEILRITRERALAGTADVEFIAHARRDIRLLISHLRGTRALSPEELHEIESRSNQASRGLWRAFLEEEGDLGGCDVISVSDNDSEPDLYIWKRGSLAPSADFRFVAAARQDIPNS